MAAQFAAERSDVPLPVLLSITRVETGRLQNGTVSPWPWAANISGQSYFFDTKLAAVKFAAAEIEKGNLNFDIGCFQINLRWHSKGFASLDAAFDPVTNAQYAANYLASLYLEMGTWPQAVATYHSRTPSHANTYLKKVEAAWDAMQTPQRAAPPRPIAPARANSFPLLQQGTGVNGSLVPQEAAAVHRFTLR
ncbi:MAG: transglycosylase SLT domain-containing protein [Cypionkella sp.]|nr:transglycosylase SLT domain-containing protein [Cypionkella sp.]